jgi:predicted N-acetyltransferase YhbS
MGVDIRLVEQSDEDLTRWWRARSIGYLSGTQVGEQDLAYLREAMDPSRTWGAFEDGRCVATFRGFTQEVTVPGGRFLASAVVSGVTVSPTHRRRGLLTRMIEPYLRRAKESGDAMSSLIAAEYPIYGRFGYGPATWLTDFRIDTLRAARPGLPAEPDDGGRVVLADLERVGREGPELHERVRRIRHGMVTRPPTWWKRATGEYRLTESAWQEPYCALYLAQDGTVDGLVAYTGREVWKNGVPDSVLDVKDLLAATPGRPAAAAGRRRPRRHAHGLLRPPVAAAPGRARHADRPLLPGRGGRRPGRPGQGRAGLGPVPAGGRP